MEHLVYPELLLFVYLADNEQYQLSKQSSIKVKNLMFTVYRIDKPQILLCMRILGQTIMGKNINSICMYNSITLLNSRN